MNPFKHERARVKTRLSIFAFIFSSIFTAQSQADGEHTFNGDNIINVPDNLCRGAGENSLNVSKVISGNPAKFFVADNQVVRVQCPLPMRAANGYQRSHNAYNLNNIKEISIVTQGLESGSGIIGICEAFFSYALPYVGLAQGGRRVVSNRQLHTTTWSEPFTFATNKTRIFNYGVECEFHSDVEVMSLQMIIGDEEHH
ncbi:hypothetical protein [Agaribacterium haliotis]|uniref:hypothetical protein n=1 Tax=Agaribacterium haliotis TaxID=2013869 RepID=UPI000BB5933F|nr:hypothetical protein [Agaribacterium haliotis]